MLTEKEKLEEELKLLKESLDLEVITKEEFENAKQRITAKLNELSTLEQKDIEVKENVEIKEQQKPEEKPEITEESKPEDKKEGGKIEIKELRESDIKKEEIKHEVAKEKGKEETVKPEEEQKEAETEIKEEEQKKLEETKKEAEVIEEKPEEVEKEEVIGEEEPVEIVEEDKKSNKKIFVYIAIILVLGFVSGYFFFSGKSDAPVEILIESISLIVACSSNEECSREGSIGVCNNPGKENAECEYIEDMEVKLMVLNNKNCFNCDTGRVLSILNSFFPNIKTENIDFETEKGKEVANKYNIIALPAYILNSSLAETHNYPKFLIAFNKVGSSYVMKTTVANSNYYLNREEITNKLDLFLKPGEVSSSKAEENLKEFLEAFDGKVDFKKHNAESEIVKELGINTFPAFLINNNIKFGGVQDADKIRKNFCQVNSVTPCALGLSKSLV